MSTNTTAATTTQLSRLPIACLLLVIAALAAAVPAQAVKRRAFVTSITGTGNLGSWPEAGGSTGLAAGNAICRNRANAAGLPNANTYRAWLSTATTDAYCHIRGLSGLKGACTGGTPLEAGPWYLANGITNFTGTIADLSDEGEIYRPVMMNEFGTILPAAHDQRYYWTGTEPDGTVFSGAPWHCNGWTNGNEGASAAVGNGFGTAYTWTIGGFAPSCSSSQRLLCLEPGPSDVVTLKWSPAYLTFLTKAAGSGNLASWPGANGHTGLAAGDAICQAEAASAGLPAPESFVAWLSTAAVDARDRITSDGRFKRVDAYTVADTKADLTDGSLDTSIHQHADGDYMVGTPEVLTGTLADGTAGGPDCEGYTSASLNSSGVRGRPNWARVPDWTSIALGGCSGLHRLYCFSNREVLFWDGFDLTGDTSRWSSTVP